MKQNQIASILLLNFIISSTMATINPTMCPTKTDAECVRLVNDYHVCKEIWDKTDEHYG